MRRMNNLYEDLEWKARNGGKCRPRKGPRTPALKNALLFSDYDYAKNHAATDEFPCFEEWKMQNPIPCSAAEVKSRSRTRRRQDVIPAWMNKRHRPTSQKHQPVHKPELEETNELSDSYECFEFGQKIEFDDDSRTFKLDRICGYIDTNSLDKRKATFLLIEEEKYHVDKPIDMRTECVNNHDGTESADIIRITIFGKEYVSLKTEETWKFYHTWSQSRI